MQEESQGRDLRRELQEERGKVGGKNGRNKKNKETT